MDFAMMKPSVVAHKREKQFMEHVYKCFTFGKPVRRIEPLVYDEGSRVTEIKSKFNRVRLIRRYFSVKRRNLHRKFDFPIDQLGRLVRNQNKTDYQQYCIESDFEHEYPRRNLRQEFELAPEVRDLKRIQLGIVSERVSRSQSAFFPREFNQPGD